MTTDKYERPPEIAAELASLPGEEESALLEQLRAASLEVLVIARRRTQDEALRERIDEIVVDRVSQPLRSAVSRHGEAPPGELDEVQDEAMVMFWEEIQDESFFEVRFNLAMKTLARHAGRRVRGGKQRNRERLSERIGTPGGFDDDESVDVAATGDDYAALHNQWLVREGLAQLPEEQANAMALHYLMEFPVHSQNPTVPTVSSLLRCSERKARGLLAKGRHALRGWIDQEEHDG